MSSAEEKCRTAVDAYLKECREFAEAAPKMLDNDRIVTQWIISILEKAQEIAKKNSVKDELSWAVSDDDLMTFLGSKNRRPLNRLLKNRRIVETLPKKYVLKRHTSALESRRSDDITGKQIIAQLCSSLMFGFRDKNFDFSERLTAKLARIAVKNQRTCILDAGSTTEQLAIEFANRVDREQAYLSSLSILTNGINVIEVLDRFEHPAIDAIIVGGNQRYQTTSIVGAIADRFIDMLDVRVDISFIGASSLTLQEGGVGVSGTFACNHEAERTTKARLLSKGQLKVVVMTKDKISHTTAASSNKRGSWVFATTDDVDILVTEGPEPNDWLRRIPGLCVLSDTGLQSTGSRAKVMSSDRIKLQISRSANGKLHAQDRVDAEVNEDGFIYVEGKQIKVSGLNLQQINAQLLASFSQDKLGVHVASVVLNGDDSEDE